MPGNVSMMQRAMPVSLIAAMDDNRLIAKEGGIPWKLPKDVEHFRSYTRDQCLLVGRRTYLEMQGWFKREHFPIVLTSGQNWTPAEGIAVSTVKQAIDVAVERQAVELVCIGGGLVFEMAMPFATAMIMSHVHACIEPGVAPVYFPTWEQDEWRCVHLERYQADVEHAYAFDIARWERVIPYSVADGRIIQA